MSVVVSPYVRTLAILVLGALFLFFFGANQAYRSDEVWSLRAVSMPTPAMMDELKSDIHPPLYYWMLRGWRAFVGENEIATRSLSILLCLGAAALVFAAARDHWGKPAALLAVAVFITSPLATLAAQMVRMYGLLAFASAASTYAFLRLVHTDRFRFSRSLLLYIAANILGSFTHVWFFFLLLAQGVVYLAYRRTANLGPMIAAATTSLAPYALVWLPVLLRQLGKSSSAVAWIEPPHTLDLLGTALFLGGISTLALPFLWFRERREATGALLPALIAVLAVAIPFAVSLWKPVYGQRFTIIALPAFSLAAGSLASKRESGHALESGLVVTACVLAIGLNAYNSQCDSRQAAAYLVQNTKPGDAVVFTSLSRLPIDYYWNRLQPHRRISEQTFPLEIDTHAGFEGAVEISPEHQQEAQALAMSLSGERVFFLHGFHPSFDHLVIKSLESRFTPIDKLALSCASMGSYFQYISAYSCANRTSEADSSKPRY